MPTLVFEHTPFAGAAGILGTTLRNYGHRFRFVRPASASGLPDAMPDDLDDVDAIVATDGAQTLLTNSPSWAAAEMALLQQAHARQIPIVGLGFGARILAKALGGELSAEGDHGWQPNTLSFVGREEPIYKGIPWSTPQLFWQSESLAKLPDGAVSYSASVRHAHVPRAQPATPPLPKPTIRAFAAGVFTFGFEHQWWLDATMFARVGAPHEVQWSDHGAVSERLGARIAENIALYLMPVDRVNAGRTKDLHY